jgi:hypothetical protein
MLTGTLEKVTIGVGDDSTLSCGANPGVKINIQYKNGLYCSVPLPSLSAGASGHLNNLGDCKLLDFEVGRESIDFWIYSTEYICLYRIELLFSTQTGQKVTFSDNVGEDSYWRYSTTIEYIFSLEKQSSNI